MKNLFILCVVFCLTYPMGCSTTEDEKEPTPKVSPMIGDWEAINWYCTNEQNCSQDPYYVDLDASVTFTISAVEEDGSMVVVDIFYHSPECVRQENCMIPEEGIEYVTDSASFINGQVYIDFTVEDAPNWHNIFKGYMEGEVIVGTLRERYDNIDIDYIKNSDVVIIKQ